MTRGDVAEVAHLSSAMTRKCLAANIPADGQKSIIICPQGIPATNEGKAEILMEHIRAVKAVDGGVIFGPDMENDEDVLDIIARGGELRDYVTGLSTGCGGLSIDKKGYTGIGLADAIERAVEAQQLRSVRATIQGYGAVGAHVSLPLSRMGVIIKAVSNQFGVLVAHTDEGIDVKALFELRSEVGDAALKAYAEENASRVKFISDREVLLRVPCDLFVPAARTSVLARADELNHARDENPHVKTAEEFLTDTGVRLVAEGANYPLTKAAEKHLESNGVFILPDIIVNCGGLIGCYLEWLWRRQQSSIDSLSELDRRSKEQIKAIVGRNVEFILRNKALGAREASHRIIEENLSALQKGNVPDLYSMKPNPTRDDSNDKFVEP